jgi:lipid A ethanolaminephosphotransferase
VASVAWFSERYREAFPEKVEAALANQMAPATTHSLFHTMADMASIESPYFEREVSLLNSGFNYQRPRYYLDDHNHAVRLDREIGIDNEQQEFFRLAGINP